MSLLFQVTLGNACDSGKFTESGDCCSLCPAGFGVKVECGKEDTKCVQCPKGKHLQSNVTPPIQNVFQVPQRFLQCLSRLTLIL